ncbi:uncharacterized protein LOC119665686 [Teleopsis dalmanni]|uniref:uncharacterized protein LOC119665686 n=1 Tax=Teleopsis dalmanni TaxID=139649 RepID=UPI0018CE9CD1|nr:uncharacterized protein LOC119665686 [Teleopsis dalmanni]
MKKAKRWLLPIAALLVVLVTETDAVAPFKKVSIGTTTTTTTTTSTTTTEAPAIESDDGKGKIEGKRDIDRKQFSWLWTQKQEVGSLINVARCREQYAEIVKNL